MHHHITSRLFRSGMVPVLAGRQAEATGHDPPDAHQGIESIHVVEATLQPLVVPEVPGGSDRFGTCSTFRDALLPHCRGLLIGSVGKEIGTNLRPGDASRRKTESAGWKGCLECRLRHRPEVRTGVTTSRVGGESPVALDGRGGPRRRNKPFIERRYPGIPVRSAGQLPVGSSDHVMGHGAIRRHGWSPLGSPPAGRSGIESNRATSGTRRNTWRNESERERVIEKRTSNRTSTESPMA